MKVITKSEKETKKLGKDLASKLTGGEVVCLIGDLGTGKTQFVKGLAAGLGVREGVISPTFMIMREYEGEKLKLYHFDFYRMESVDEMKDIGLEEALEDEKGVVVIEWAERGEKLLPEECIKVKFKWVDEGRREIGRDLSRWKRM